MEHHTYKEFEKVVQQTSNFWHPYLFNSHLDTYTHTFALKKKYGLRGMAVEHAASFVQVRRKPFFPLH